MLPRVNSGIKFQKNVWSIFGNEYSVLLSVLNSHFSVIWSSNLFRQEMYTSDFIQDFQARICVYIKGLWSWAEIYLYVQVNLSWLFLLYKIFVLFDKTLTSCDRLRLPVEWLVSSIRRSGGDTVPKGFQKYSKLRFYSPDKLVTGVITRINIRTARQFVYAWESKSDNLLFTFWNPYGNKKSYDFLGTGGISKEDIWQPFKILSEEVTKQAERSRFRHDPQYPWRFSSLSSPSHPISMQTPEMQILSQDFYAFGFFWNLKYRVLFPRLPESIAGRPINWGH